MALPEVAVSSAPATQSLGHSRLVPGREQKCLRRPTCAASLSLSLGVAGRNAAVARLPAPGRSSRLTPTAPLMWMPALWMMRIGGRRCSGACKRGGGRHWFLLVGGVAHHCCADACPAHWAGGGCELTGLPAKLGTGLQRGAEGPACNMLQNAAQPRVAMAAQQVATLMACPAKQAAASGLLSARPMPHCVQGATRQGKGAEGL